ncbi:GTP-binding protein, partial [Streptomyces sp. SID7760]|nr:GTP-binding protein [Streptomyces sp. SID7760]
ARARRLRATLSRLNPEARIVQALRGQVALDQVLGTGLFDVERAQQAPGWVRELNGEHVPETEEYGISSLVFRSDELVFIGTGLRTEALRAALEPCLLAPDEPVPTEDEFPQWETYGIDDTCVHEHAAA